MCFTILLVLSLSCFTVSIAGGPTAKVKDLFQLHKLFHIIDIDDDNYLEYDDGRQIMLRYDLDNDGEFTLDEMLSDPSMKANHYGGMMVSEKFATIDDLDTFFRKAQKYGNDIDLGEFLNLMTKRENKQNLGQGMNIQSFVDAHDNFFVIDTNDDGHIVLGEFEADFRFADHDNDLLLNSDEFDAFRPTFHIEATDVCADVVAGCSAAELLELFDKADKDKDDQLAFEEYINYFGELMDKKKSRND